MSRLVIAVQVFAALALTGACTPAPAWMPGDPPLEIWAPDDEVWAAMKRGCEAWRESVGLECARATDREAAPVTAAIGLTKGWGRAWTTAAPDFGGTQVWEQEFHVKFRERAFLSETYVAAHELGHVLGVWDHLEEPGCLMSAAEIGSPVPTAADVDALLEVWGMTEAEL